MTQTTSFRFSGRDGADLAGREAGSGRPLIMLHGFVGDGAQMFEYGQIGGFAERGRRVIVPDFRGHGRSARPHDPAAYPPDVLADDGLALLEHLGLAEGEYDLGGYSLGARITVRMLARGARPARAIVAGQGLAKVCGPQQGSTNRPVLTALAEGGPIAPGTRDAQIAHWVEKLGADPRALVNVLDSLVPTTREELRRITVPTLVVIGEQDERSDADELAALLPDSRFARVPGDHGTAFAAPELFAEMRAFLGDD